ncbi:MAG: hypothetical protein V2A74_09350 [bacterium]
MRQVPAQSNLQGGGLEAREDGAWRRQLWVAAVAAVSVAAVWICYQRVSTFRVIDDAYITYTYARNVAEWNGFQFSDRYTTLGTTTPLFTLLLALCANLGVAIPKTALALDFLALALQIFLAAALFHYLDRSRWIPLLVLFFSVLMWWHTPSMPGMEYGLYTACCMGALVAVCLSNWVAAGLFAATAATLRVDGGLILLLTACAWALHARCRGPMRARVAFLLALVLLPAVWYSYSLAVFGRFTPQSLDTRRVEAIGAGFFKYGWHYYLFNRHTLSYLLMASFLGLCLAIRRRPRTVWFAVFFVSYVVMYISFGLPDVPGYYCPLQWMAIVFAGFALAETLHTILRRSAPRLSRAGVAATCLGLALVVACSLNDLRWGIGIWRYSLQSAKRTHKLLLYKAIALWMNERLPADTRFATNEIGVLGYFAGRDLLEIGGLVNKEGLDYLRSGKIGELVARMDPEVIVVPDPFIDAIVLSPGGEMVRGFNELATMVGEADGLRVRVWVRKEWLSPERLEEERGELQRFVAETREL